MFCVHVIRDRALAFTLKILLSASARHRELILVHSPAARGQLPAGRVLVLQAQCFSYTAIAGQSLTNLGSDLWSDSPPGSKPLSLNNNASASRAGIVGEPLLSVPYPLGIVTG